MFNAPVSEWLITDGRGGFVCGTASGRITRRWHGWWIASKPPRERVQLLLGIEARIETESGRIILLLDESHDGVWTRGGGSAAGLTGMASIPGETERSVTWIWECSGPDGRCLRIHWQLHAPDDTSALRLHVRPLLVPEPVVDRIDIRSVLITRDETLQLIARADTGLEFSAEDAGERLLDAAMERACEKTAEVAAWAGPRLTMALAPNQTETLAFLTTERADEPDSGGETTRDQTGLPDIPVLSDGGDGIRDADAFARALDHAASQFIVTTASGRKTIMAGYPWFTDWGRDTMIALPGLCIHTGRLDDAADIIDNFLEHTSDGLIPNLFPEHGEEPMYNTIDATLWLFEAAFQLDRAMQAQRNERFITVDRFIRLGGMIEWHIRGTRNHIHVEGDGLLGGGDAGSQLTWMDVRIDDHVPTPRHGKPVEIQGLWFNALTLMVEEARDRRERSLVRQWDVFAHQCRTAFVDRFFAPDHDHAADVVDRDGPGTADFTLRPNMVIPFALTHNIIPANRRAGILQAAAERLVTPRGLRSLDPDSSRYHGIYSGPREKRDLAYHQGTVWMWLAMPYLKGVHAERERVPDLYRRAHELLEGLYDHFGSEACRHQASEIFDGDYPHVPRGCFAQAWSVAAIIEAFALDWDEAGGAD